MFGPPAFQLGINDHNENDVVSNFKAARSRVKPPGPMQRFFSYALVLIADLFDP